jgi:hypothetical protein
VSNEEKRFGPDLIRRHAQKEVKDRTAATCGAKLVLLPMMKSTPDQHDPDWPRYPETILSFATRPPVEIDLRGIPSEKALSRLKQAGFGQPFAIVTAFDPQGKDLPAAENEKRNDALEKKVAARGYKFARVEACSPDRSHCESSVAAIMPQDEAIELAKEMQQVALFWFDGERFWILGGIVESDPLMLPRSS